MDSGTLINKPLIKIFEIIHNNNIYTFNNADSILQLTHNDTYKYFENIDKTKKFITAGFIGFNYNVGWIKQLIHDWKYYSMIKDCIAPIGSNRSNHRQDLSVISILYRIYQKN